MSESTMLNLLNHSYKNTPASLKNRYGFYILCRVRFHVTYTEEYDKGWGEATEALQSLWFSFGVNDLDKKAEAA